jgi:2-phosphosulfolactate phosphatase
MSDLFKHKVHVLFRKEDLDHERLEGKVAIVLDVLFATSTIITALANGATEVIPTLDEAGANAERKHPKGIYVLGGTVRGDLPVASPTPLALLKKTSPAGSSFTRPPTARWRCGSPRTPITFMQQHC